MKNITIFSIIAITMGILLAVVGAFVMRDSGIDMSHLVAGSPSQGLPWILLIGLVVVAAGIAALWPAFRKRPE